ncbi:hypothetical protein FEK48_24675 [Escherichia sp. E2593]|uniref:hypothetical protein n=1 Tax=Escherichia sp. E2593 TaxID=2044458 RepID=UPI0010FDED49|nr:hypothetical protein [Escherichia sp. E2593]TLI74258.1 hypothetical protein FEK48_24675 [Escherichia sp. E2593]
MSFNIINTTYKKIERDGLTMTISQRKGPVCATLYSPDGRNLKNNHIYYLIKIFDAENNPIKKSPFKYHVDVVTKNDWSSLDTYPTLKISYEGDAKKLQQDSYGFYNTETDQNGEFLFGILPFLTLNNAETLIEKTMVPYVQSITLTFYLGDISTDLVVETPYNLDLRTYDAVDMVVNSTGDFRDLTDTVTLIPGGNICCNRKVCFCFSGELECEVASSIEGVAIMDVDKNNQVTMPFTEEEIANREVWAYTSFAWCAMSPLRIREANSSRQLHVSPQNNSNIFPGQTLYATFRYQLKAGESFSGTGCPFTLNRGNFYPPEISWWQEGNTLYGGCLLTVDDSLMQGDLLSWTVSCCLDNSGVPVASETVNWNVAWDADINVDVTFVADTPVLIDYSNDDTRPLSSRPAMTWWLTVPGLSNTQACFYPLVTRITEDAIISDASFSEIAPCMADRTSRDYFYVMLDDQGSAVINVQPRENRTLLTAFSAGIYGVGTMINTANFFINSAWESATAPSVSVTEGQNPQARPGDDNYGLATFPLLSNWEAVKQHDLLGGAVYLFAGEEVQRKNHYTPLMLLGKTQIPLKAGGGAPDIALYFTESNFETGKTYYIHACLVENAYLHKGVNYLRLQEIRFEIPQEQPAVPEGVKRTYRAPQFVCKDGAVIDEDDVLLGRNEIGYQGLEYRIPLSGGQKHLVAGDQIMATAYLHAWNKQTQEMENSNPLLKLNQPHTVTDADINRGYLTDVISIDDLAGCDMPPQGVDQSTLRVEYYCQNKQEYSYLREVFIDMYP